MIQNGGYMKMNTPQYKIQTSMTMVEGNGVAAAASGGRRRGKGGGSKAAKSASSKMLNSSSRFHCAICTKSYLRKRHLQRHVRDECIGIPPRFSCDLCPSRFRRKYHMVRHLTTKHGVPPNIAQQTKGNSNRSRANLRKTNSQDAENLTLHRVALSNCDNGLPENLTMRKVNYEYHPVQLLQQHQHNASHQQQFIMRNTSPLQATTSGDSGSDYNGGGTDGTSPIPRTHLMTMPTYGLTGAITAISAAAAHVEEKDANILLEAAAAAAAAQAAANNNLQPHCSNSHSISNIMTPPPPPMPLPTAALYENGENVADNQASSSGSSKAAGEALAPPMHMLDDEWKMKLSLQLISNTLLKERLMNNMPYAYKNN